VDIYEDEHTIAVKMEVRSIDEKDIDVRIESSTLTVRRGRKIEEEENQEIKRIRRTSAASSGSAEVSPARSRSRFGKYWASERRLSH